MFNLTAKQNKKTIQQINIVLGYLAIGALVVVTAVHAVSLVVNEVGDISGVMGVIRILSPILLESFAAVCAVGFFTSAYKGSQRVWATAVEVVWVIFAGLNLITSFTIDSGEALPNALWAWLHYGLPVSALIGGVLFYVTLRVDPDKLRANEQKAAQEEHEQLIFEAKLAVIQSDQMKQVLQNQAWLGVVSRMQADGYTPDQIGYMMQSVPNLLVAPNQAEPPKVDTTTPTAPIVKSDEAEPSASIVKSDDTAVTLNEETVTAVSLNGNGSQPKGNE